MMGYMVHASTPCLPTPWGTQGTLGTCSVPGAGIVAVHSFTSLNPHDSLIFQLYILDEETEAPTGKELYFIEYKMPSLLRHATLDITKKNKMLAVVMLRHE